MWYKTNYEDDIDMAKLSPFHMQIEACDIKEMDSFYNLICW